MPQASAAKAHTLSKSDNHFGAAEELIRSLEFNPTDRTLQQGFRGALSRVKVAKHQGGELASVLRNRRKNLNATYLQRIRQVEPQPRSRSSSDGAVRNGAGVVEEAEREARNKAGVVGHVVENEGATVGSESADDKVDEQLRRVEGAESIDATVDADEILDAPTADDSSHAVVVEM